MNNDSKQASPGQAAAEAQETIKAGKVYGGGDALLEVEDKANSGEVVDEAIATNTTGNTASNAPGDAK
ncbi:MAG: hypothetical protein ACFB4I_07495 [Cyanophyceae cyanobacterium]